MADTDQPAPQELAAAPAPDQESSTLSPALEEASNDGTAASEAALEASGTAGADDPRGASTEHGDPAGSRLRQLYERIHQLDVAELINQWGVNEIVLRDVISSLARPGRDPREDLPAPVFRRGIVRLEDLEPGMQLSGTVLNVVDFGAFVDIGLSDSGLVHISRLADRFVRDPHEVVGVGDVLAVWVVEIDKQRRRVSLTAIEPGTERSAETRQRTEKRPPRRGGGKCPPAKGARPPKGRERGRPPRERDTRPPRRTQKPKIVKPITKEMEEGKEPLRSFSDLMQFYQKKQSDEDQSKS